MHCNKISVGTSIFTWKKTNLLVMSKNSLGEIKLSPMKENGRFVFINSEVRVNGKLNKGDYIKIYVEGYEEKEGQYVIKNLTHPTSKLVVRGNPMTLDLPADIEPLEDLYNKVGEMYKNQFYFGKIEI
jgi:hypothetical protein